MDRRVIAAACTAWFLFTALSPATALAADQPKLTIDEIFILSEVKSGNFSRVRKFGFLLVEVRGHLQLPDAPRDLHFQAALTPQPAEVTIDDPFDAGLLGVGLVNEKGETNYPYLTGMPAAEVKRPYSAKLPGGAGIEIHGAGGARTIRFLASDTPVALVFRYPAPKQPELKTGVDLYLGGQQSHADGPALVISLKDLGWAIPANKQKEADRTFAAGLPFFLWTDKPVVPANENYLRFALNPKLTLDSIPKTDDIATKIEIVVTHKNAGGARAVPFTSTVNGQFGNYRWGKEYQGRGKAALTILESSNDPKNVENAPPLSNRLNLQLSFDPVRPAKSSKQRSGGK